MRFREPQPPAQDVKTMDHFFRQVRLGAHDRPISVDSRHYQPPPIRGGPGLAERLPVDSMDEFRASTPDQAA